MSIGFQLLHNLIERWNTIMNNKLSNLYKLFPFIEKLTINEKQQFIEQSLEVKYEKNKVLMNEGMVCNGAIFVIEGSVRVYKVSEEGKEITLYRVEKGETCIMTISCILADVNYQAVAEVEENVTLLMLPSNAFRALFATSTAFQQFVFSTLSTRMIEVMMIVEEIAFKSMNTRISSFLLEKIKKQNENVIKITHEKIALELGTAREVVSRVLMDLQKKGVVEISRGQIKVRDVNLLTFN